jgi:ankyrin repeat protein
MDTMHELVEGGINLNVADLHDPLQPTPLHCAVKYLHKSVVEILVMNGADINLKRTDGLTALDIVLKNDPVRDIKTRELRKSIAAILIRNGATAAKYK